MADLNKENGSFEPTDLTESLSETAKVINPSGIRALQRFAKLPNIILAGLILGGAYGLSQSRIAAADPSYTVKSVDTSGNMFHGILNFGTSDEIVVGKYDDSLQRLILERKGNIGGLTLDKIIADSTDTKKATGLGHVGSAVSLINYSYNSVTDALNPAIQRSANLDGLNIDLKGTSDSLDDLAQGHSGGTLKFFKVNKTTLATNEYSQSTGPTTTDGCDNDPIASSANVLNCVNMPSQAVVGGNVTFNTYSLNRSALTFDVQPVSLPVTNTNIAGLSGTGMAITNEAGHVAYVFNVIPTGNTGGQLEWDSVTGNTRYLPIYSLNWLPYSKITTDNAMQAVAPSWPQTLDFSILDRYQGLSTPDDNPIEYFAHSMGEEQATHTQMPVNGEIPPKTLIKNLKRLFSGGFLDILFNYGTKLGTRHVTIDTGIVPGPNTNAPILEAQLGTIADPTATPTFTSSPTATATGTATSTPTATSTIIIQNPNASATPTRTATPGEQGQGGKGTVLFLPTGGTYNGNSNATQVLSQPVAPDESGFRFTR